MRNISDWLHGGVAADRDAPLPDEPKAGSPVESKRKIPKKHQFVRHRSFQHVGMKEFEAARGTRVGVRCVLFLKAAVEMPADGSGDKANQKSRAAWIRCCGASDTFDQDRIISPPVPIDSGQWQLPAGTSD